MANIIQRSVNLWRVPFIGLLSVRGLTNDMWELHGAKTIPSQQKEIMCYICEPPQCMPNIG